ncbi:MAG: hypothetical protein NVS2B16_30070 [Chloroflexota bacterium]
MEQDQQLFAILYSPGPNWQQNQQTQDEGIKKHRDYIKRLRQNHTLLQGGDVENKKHGAPIIHASDHAEALGKATQDPAVQTGVLKVAVVPWTIVFGTHAPGI